MPVSPKTDGKKIIPSLVYIKILVFICLIGISSVILMPIQTSLAQVMDSIRNNFIGNLENTTGLEIRYASIRPSFFGSFEIRNLRLYKDGRAFLSVSRAGLRFSLTKLILGSKDAVHTVYIDRPVLRMDLKRDSDLIEKILAGRKTENNEEEIILQKIAEYLPKNVNYKIRDCSLLFVNGDFVCQFDRMNFSITGEKGGILFDSSFETEMRYSGFRDRTIVFHANVGIKSTGDGGLETINAGLSLSSLTCSEQKIIKGPASFFRPVSTMERTGLTTLFTVRPFDISLSYNDRIIYIDQTQENQYIDYSFRCNLKSGIVTSHLNMNEFISGSYINFQENLTKLNHLLGMAISGNFWFLINENGTANYNVNYSCGDDKDGFKLDAYGTNSNFILNEFGLYASEKTVKAGLFQGAVNANGKIPLKPFRPDLNISFSNFTLTGKESVNAEIEITSGDEEIIILSRNLLFGEIGIDELYMSINPAEKDIVMLASVICRDNSAAFFDAVVTRLPGQFDAILNLDSFSLYNMLGIMRPFADFISLPDFTKGFFKNNRLDAEIYFSSDLSSIVYNAPNIVLKNKNIVGEMSVSGTDRQFNISHGVYYLSEDDAILINANTIINNHMDLNFIINASYRDVTWNIDGQILDGTTLILRDPNGLHAYGNTSISGAISGYIEGIDFPVPVNGNLIYLNFYMALRYNSFDFWSVDVSYFEANKVNSKDGESAFKIAGSADQDGASFREIIFNDSIGMLFGNADFAWDYDFSYLQFFISMTDGYENGEYYNFEGIFKNNHINIKSDISNMHIERFVRGAGTMLASAEANINYDSINSFIADINVKSFYTKTQEEELQASGNIHLTNDNVKVQELKIEFSTLTAFLPSIEISRTNGEAAFKTDVKGTLLGKIFDVQVDFNADFGKMNAWTDVSQALEKFNGELNVQKFHYGDILHYDVGFLFSGDNGSISVIGGVDEMLRLEMDELGNFYMGLSYPLPIRGSIAGTLSKDFILDAHCNYFFIDMKTLWALAGDSESEVSFGGGFITGKIDIRGPVWNPEFFGIGKGSSFIIKVPNFIAQDIRPVPFNVIAEGYEMTFGPAVTVCGMGGGSVKGWFRFEYWAPKNIGIEIDIPRDTPIPYNINIAGIESEGDVSGYFNLLVHTTEENITVSGDLFMNNTEIGLNIADFTAESATISDDEYDTIVDLKITTGPMVEFFWPNKNNPIIRANPEMGTVLAIKADTQARQFSINSEINIRSGELLYLDRNFFIRKGTLTLNENESEFNPYITARAEIRERIDSGPVTISMIVENQPLLSFEPRFEANPDLTQLELYSLLGQTYSIQDSDNPDDVQRFFLTSTTDIVTQIVSGSDVLGQLIIFRQIERQVRDFLNLDMLSIRTRFIQNIAGTVPFERNPRVGNYFDNTTVSIGKYIGQDMFIQGTLTMKYDENSALLGGIRFEPDIGIEWRSPFVNIRWDFIPSSPQNWFVNDNSITLSWSKTF